LNIYDVVITVTDTNCLEVKLLQLQKANNNKIIKNKKIEVVIEAALRISTHRNYRCFMGK